MGTSFALDFVMHFRYKDPRGNIIALEDVAWLAQAVRNGVVTPDTPLAVGDEATFQSAELVVAYQQVVVGLERNQLGTAPPPARGRVMRRPVKSRARATAFGIVGAAVLALLYFLARTPGSASDAVSRPAVPGPEMQAALEVLSTGFGDSIARRQRRLEEWLAAQRIDQRLQGRELQAPASLRALRSVAAGYLGRVDTLQSSVSVLSSRLLLQADSLEGADGVRHGLFAAAGDALRGWERDLGAYAEVQRARAATIDSLAEFTLSRPQAFVVRDGQPVFLSRTDAARFQELGAQLDDLVSKERRWAENVIAKNPNWMAALAPADRPAFHRPPLPLQRSNQ